MASDDENEDYPQPFDAKQLSAKKRNSSDASPPRHSNGKKRDPGDQDELPQPFDAKALAPAKKRQRSTSPSDAPRKLKRPGQRARITNSEAAAIRQRHEQRERESEQQMMASAAVAPGGVRGINDIVREHYNAVPERGRDWRKTGSRIKGLRVFNNWVKSTLIQKFSPDEDHTPGAHQQGRDMAGARGGHELIVLDMGCGKGGDLGKWQQAPQRVQLYVGLDPANVSIEQARERYRSMGSRGGGRGGRGGYRGGGRQQHLFDCRFLVKDCYSALIDDVEIVRQVGFDPSPMGHGSFDIVSMMFCMHYAFESEEKARNMLRNVSGALKKGGRFIGCIPSSDIISSRVTAFNERKGTKAEDGSAPEEGEAEDKEEGEAEDTAEWGNDLYRVRFPGKTPEDGIFRPPFGWKYSFFLDEAVEEVPEYVVPWEAFRAIAEDYNLEMQYHSSFREIWETEKDDPILGPLSERMGVRERGKGPLLVSEQELEIANFYVAFCFYKV